ncbi:hypothetical protein [Nocardiopsis sp. NPDC006938]|uniref:hypothetical protein n=1 Tax=Nocardiopsis sp. NPDC006938 TaxID=3364337 RepID=UPI0036AF2032
MAMTTILWIAIPAVAGVGLMIFPATYSILFNRLKTYNNKRKTDNLQNDHERIREEFVNDTLENLTKISEIRNEISVEVIENARERLDDIENALKECKDTEEKAKQLLANKVVQLQPLVEAGILQKTTLGRYKILSLPNLNDAEKKAAEQFIARHNSTCRNVRQARRALLPQIREMKQEKKRLQLVIDSEPEELLQSYNLSDDDLREISEKIVEYCDSMLKEISSKGDDPAAITEPNSDVAEEPSSEGGTPMHSERSESSPEGATDQTAEDVSPAPAATPAFRRAILENLRSRAVGIQETLPPKDMEELEDKDMAA